MRNRGNLSRPQCVNCLQACMPSFCSASIALYQEIYRTGPQFNVKLIFYQYMKSHCGDKTVVRSSNLPNGIPLLVRWHFSIESGPCLSPHHTGGNWQAAYGYNLLTSLSLRSFWTPHPTAPPQPHPTPPPPPPPRNNVINDKIYENYNT